MIVELSGYLATIGLLLTCFINSLVIRIAYYNSKAIIGSYKHLIIAFSWMGVLFSIVEFLVKPVTHNYKACLLIFNNSKIFDFSPFLSLSLLMFFGGSYAVTIHILTIQFIYRYWALFKSYNVKKYFDTFQNALLWFTSCFICFTTWSGFLYFGKPSEYLNDYMRSEIKQFYGRNIEDISYLAAVAATKSESLNWKGLVMLVGLLTITISHYVTIAIYGVNMYLKMNDTLSSLSDHIQAVHKQLLKTLMIQIAVPTVLVFLPIISVFIIPFLGLDASIPMSPFISSLSIYPAIDGIVVLYFIEDYRNDVIARFHHARRPLRLPNLRFNCTTI